MGTNAVAAVPVLVRCLKDCDPGLDITVVTALGDLGLEPDVVVPELSSGLEVPSIRIGSACALGNFGILARPAIPALLRVLNDPDQHMRLVVTNALRKIAPEVLERGRQ